MKYDRFRSYLDNIHTMTPDYLSVIIIGVVIVLIAIMVGVYKQIQREEQRDNGQRVETNAGEFRVTIADPNRFTTRDKINGKRFPTLFGPSSPKRSLLDDLTD